MTHRLSRRGFIRLSAIAAAGVPFGSALAACSDADEPAEPPRIPTRERPVTWPIAEGAEPIDDGLPVERGASLRVYQWREYLYGDVIASFTRAHAADDVDVQVESFSDIHEAIARLREPHADFDVFFPTIETLGDLVAEGLLRPLNHAYLPNLRNLWPRFTGPDAPFYDRGQRYTVPYTVYSSGIGWRADLTGPGMVERLEDPSGALWDPACAPMSAFVDQYREALALGLVHAGGDDVNTTDPETLRRAGDALLDAIDAGARISAGSASEELAEGTLAVRQAWSGDVISALTYEGYESRSGRSGLRYWWPTDGSGIVGCDLTAICARGRYPMLAHAFVNHLLDTGVALENFSWNGYQPPVADAVPEAFADPTFPWHDLIPRELTSTLLTPEGFESGRMLDGLSPAGDAAWQTEWMRVGAET